MQCQHSRGVAYYRCRYPQEYALANNVDHPKNVIIREDSMTAPLDTWLARQRAPSCRDEIIAALAQQASNEPAASPDRAMQDELVAVYDGKIARYRAAPGAGADPAVVSGWIAEAQIEAD